MIRDKRTPHSRHPRPGRTTAQERLTARCKWRPLAGWCGAALFLLGLPGAPAEVIRAGNRALDIGVDRQSGQLVELTDRATGRNFASPETGGGGLWELEFDGTPARLAPAQARFCTVEKLGGREPGLRLRWSGFELLAAPEFGVEVIVRPDRREPLARWQLALTGTGSRKPKRIHFPRLPDLPTLERERLMVPFWVGLLAQNPRQIIGTAPGLSARREYDYPGICSLQCLAFYGEGGPGLYLACDDTAGYRKTFAAFSRREGALGVEVVHLPEYRAEGDGYVLPYAAVLGTIQGGWYEAAATYRAWATNQAWARQARWSCGAVPAWVGDTGLWLWNRGRSTNVLDPAVALQRQLGLPVSVFWHWWHGCAYDTGFPEYFPPRDGTERVAAALDRVRGQGIHALLYMNQRLWGMTTASWTNQHAEVYAVKTADGRVQPEVYNRFTQLPCATMCLGTGFWRAKYAGLAVTAHHDLGADGIYMDQACSSLACFDPRHGHPLGGGTYWMAGFQAMSADIRERCRQAGPVALAGEGCAENWLPYLDLMLALDVSRERYAPPDGYEVIPLFHAVYHGYAVFYGNYSSLTLPPYDDLWPAEFAPKEPLQLLDRKFSPQFRLEQARAFLWGQQPTIANFLPAHLSERAEEIEYVLRLAKLRRLALPYLQDGTMLPPPRIESPVEEIPMSRLSIYAGQREGLREFRKSVPLVQASAWRAADGKVAVALASIADRPLNLTLSLETARFGLPKSGQIYQLANAGPVRLNAFQSPAASITLYLPARDARILEFREQ